jgi:hypothetical protein
MGCDQLQIGNCCTTPSHDHRGVGGSASNSPATMRSSQARTSECGTLRGSALASATAAARAAVSASSSSISGTADDALSISYSMSVGPGMSSNAFGQGGRQPTPCILLATPL